ncbi:MAG: hypothetical protein LBO66_14065 [Deltaproteobacteria bacterium]|jgi:uncharacterized membrane protein|nr:hypothetical protein [Deltaproteobacteria bacterium]
MPSLRFNLQGLLSPLPILALFLLALLFSPALAKAQLSAASLLGSDSFEASFTYLGETIGPEGEVSLEITLRNTGTKGDAFRVEITESPAEWTTELTRYNSVLEGIFVAGEESATLNLEAFPPGEPGSPLPEGEYPFAIKVTSQNTEKTVESRTVIKIASRKSSQEVLTLSTSYPEIGGPSDGRFAFSLDVKNNGPEEAKVNLAAEIPQDWEYSFKPGYEEKQISSIQVPRGQSRTVTLDVTPAYMAEVGSYPIRALAETTLGATEVSLTVNLTGTYKIRAGTLNELLSTSTEVGKPVTLSIYVLNEGSASQKDISFIAVKPENWEVTFEPESVRDLEPMGRPVPVEMTITPPPNALVGDYGVGLSVEGEKAQSALDFRVTVKAGGGWAWVGGIIIVIVVAALAWTFRRLGRR